jgi:hypothetical protein
VVVVPATADVEGDSRTGSRSSRAELQIGAPTTAGDAPPPASEI